MAHVCKQMRTKGVPHPLLLCLLCPEQCCDTFGVQDGLVRSGGWGVSMGHLQQLHEDARRGAGAASPVPAAGERQCSGRNTELSCRPDMTRLCVDECSSIRFIVQLTGCR